jgi:hypothetical protein
MGIFGRQSSIFPHSSKLFQLFFITYDEIFEALSVEGDVLRSKPFLQPTPPTVQPLLSPLGLSHVRQSEKTSPWPAISV